MNRSSTGVSAVLLALSALALWASSRMTWVTVDSSDGLGQQQRTDLLGSTWAAATTPLAITAVAAVAALFAVRGRWSLLLAAAIVLIAVAAAVPAVDLLVSGVDPGRAGALAELPGRAEVTDAVASAAPAVLVLGGAVLAVVAAVGVARGSRSRAGLSARYDSPAVRRERAERSDLTTGSDEGEELSERAFWDALDSGNDPTVDRSAPRPDGRSDDDETR